MPSVGRLRQQPAPAPRRGAALSAPPAQRARRDLGSFDEGRVLTEELHVFRAEGKHYGRWYGTVEPESAAHAERLYNIVDYDNDATTVSRYRIPKGRLIYDGPVAGGNGTQIFVPDSHAAGVELVETKPLVQFGF